MSDSASPSAVLRKYEGVPLVEMTEGELDEVFEALEREAMEWRAVASAGVKS